MVISTAALIAIVVATAIVAAGPGFYALLKQRQIMPVEYRDMVTAQANDRERIRELESLRATDHALITTLQEQMDEFRRGVRLLVEQLEQAKITPVWVPSRSMLNGQLSTELRRFIHSHFNHEEIDDLALRLGANPDDITGQSLLARSRSIVGYAERNELMEQLADLVRELRPNVFKNKGEQ
jgi:hypothetical protein